MTNYDDYDLQEKIEDIDKMERVLQVKQQRDFARAANNAVAAGIADALKDAGLTQDDWGRIYYADPETTLRKQKSLAKKFASKIIANSKVRDQNSRRPQASGKQPAPANGRVEERRLEAEKVLNDFFLKTLGK